MTDHLSKLPPKQVANWYYRLADSVSKKRLMAKNLSQPYF
jgi:hypothetical protein